MPYERFFLKIRRMLRCAGERFCVILGLVNADESRKGRGPPRGRAAFERVSFEIRGLRKRERKREISKGAQPLEVPLGVRTT